MLKPIHFFLHSEYNNVKITDLQYVWNIFWRDKYVVKLALTWVVFENERL